MLKPTTDISRLCSVVPDVAVYTRSGVFNRPLAHCPMSMHHMYTLSACWWSTSVIVTVYSTSKLCPSIAVVPLWKWDTSSASPCNSASRFVMHPVKIERSRPYRWHLSAPVCAECSTLPRFVCCPRYLPTKGRLLSALHMIPSELIPHIDYDMIMVCGTVYNFSPLFACFIMLMWDIMLL